MGKSVKANPQVKVACKQITPKLNIESIDKNTFNNLKKSIDKYYLSVDIIGYPGEINDDGYAVDTNDYNTWRRNHPNKISKQSVNNIIKSIKNNSLVNWTLDGYFGGTGYHSSLINSNGFYVELLSITLELLEKVNMVAASISIIYRENNLIVEILNGRFISQ